MNQKRIKLIIVSLLSLQAVFMYGTEHDNKGACATFVVQNPYTQVRVSARRITERWDMPKLVHTINKYIAENPLLMSKWKVTDQLRTQSAIGLRPTNTKNDVSVGIGTTVSEGNCAVGEAYVEIPARVVSDSSLRAFYSDPKILTAILDHEKVHLDNLDDLERVKHRLYDVPRRSRQISAASLSVGLLSMLVSRRFQGVKRLGYSLRSGIVGSGVVGGTLWGGAQYHDFQKALKKERRADEGISANTPEQVATAIRLFSYYVVREEMSSKVGVLGTLYALKNPSPHDAPIKRLRDYLARVPAQVLADCDAEALIKNNINEFIKQHRDYLEKSYGLSEKEFSARMFAGQKRCIDLVLQSKQQSQKSY